MATLKDSDALLIYQVGPVYCCAPSLPISAIIQPPHLTRPPGTSTEQPGIFKHGAHIVSVSDLRHRFGVDPKDRLQPGRMVIAQLAAGHTAFWVDNIIDVITMPGSGWGNLPALISKGVFSRTLLYKQRIHLYAEFEKLNALRHDDYLKSYIAHLQIEQVKKAGNQDDSTSPGQPSEANTSHSQQKVATPAHRVVTRQQTPSDNVLSETKEKQSKVSNSQQHDTLSSVQQAKSSWLKNIPIAESVRTTSNQSQASATRSLGIEPKHKSETAQQKLPGLSILGDSKSTRLDTANTRSVQKQIDRKRPTSTTGSPFSSGNMACAAQPQKIATASAPILAQEKPTVRITANADVKQAGHTYKQDLPGKNDSFLQPGLRPAGINNDTVSIANMTNGNNTAKGLALVFFLLFLVGGGGIYYVFHIEKQTPHTSIARNTPYHTKSPSTTTMAMNHKRPEYQSDQIDRTNPENVTSDMLEQSDEGKVGLHTNTIGQQVVVNKAEERIIHNEDDATDSELRKVDMQILDIAKDTLPFSTASSDGTFADHFDNDYHASIQKDTQGVTIILNGPESIDVLKDSEVYNPDQEKEVRVGQNTKAVLSTEDDMGQAKHILKNGTYRIAKELIHIVIKGDTLWDIAEQYVHNPFLFPELARMSNIKDPDLIYPGNRVRILQVEKIE